MTDDEAIRGHAGLFDVPSQAVIATRADGSIVYWSAAAQMLYGWKESEVLGRNVVDVTPTEMTREQAGRIMQDLRNGRTWTGTFQVRTRDGRHFDVRVRDVPVRNDAGELIGIVGVSTPAPRD